VSDFTLGYWMPGFQSGMVPNSAVAQTPECASLQFFCQPIVNERLVCVAFCNLRSSSFCGLTIQIAETRTPRPDNVPFAAPPSPESGPLCPVLTQFRVHFGYLDSDPHRDMEQCASPTPAMLRGPAFRATKDLRSPQPFPTRHLLTTCVFNNIPAL
jgi:hypothetical protein